MNRRNFLNSDWLFALLIGTWALMGCAPPASALTDLPDVERNVPATTTLDVLESLPFGSPTSEPTLPSITHINTQINSNGILSTSVYIEPPPAILEINGARQTSAIATFCWDNQCSDGFSTVTPHESLVASSSILVSLQLPINEAPDILQLHIARASKDLELHNASDNRRWWNISPRSGKPRELLLQRKQDFKLNLTSGLYVLNIFGAWNQRDVIYGFLIEVK